MAKNKIKRFDIGAILAFIFISTYCLIIVYMVYFGLQTGLKDNYDFSLDHNVFGLPNFKKYSFSLDNFTFAFEHMKVQIKGNLYASVPVQFIYGLIYAIVCAVVNVFAKVFPAYFCAKFKTFFGVILYALVVVTMLLPTVGTTAATIQMMRKLGVYDNFLGIVFYNASFTGTYFLVFYAAFRGISNAYAEAAKIDGAGEFAVLFRIYLPMVMPSMVAVGILQFIMFWNDYTVPMLYLNSMPTIALGLFKFYNNPHYSGNPTAVLAACFIVCVPTILLFIIAKNKIMGNITAGGLKG